MRTYCSDAAYAVFLGVACGAFAVAAAASAGRDPIGVAALLAFPAWVATVARAVRADRRDHAAARLAASLFPLTPADRWAKLRALESTDPGLHERTLEGLRHLHSVAKWEEGRCVGC